MQNPEIRIHKIPPIESLKQPSEDDLARFSAEIEIVKILVESLPRSIQTQDLETDGEVEEIVLSRYADLMKRLFQNDLDDKWNDCLRLATDPNKKRELRKAVQAFFLQEFFKFTQENGKIISRKGVWLRMWNDQTFSPREVYCLIKYFGLDGQEPQTNTQIAAELNVLRANSRLRVYVKQIPRTRIDSIIMEAVQKFRVSKKEQFYSAMAQYT